MIDVRKFVIIQSPTIYLKPCSTTLALILRIYLLSDILLYHQRLITFYMKASNDQFPSNIVVNDFNGYFSKLSFLEAFANLEFHQKTL